VVRFSGGVRGGLPSPEPRPTACHEMGAGGFFAEGKVAVVCS
jgi:hypothetical protein